MNFADSRFWAYLAEGLFCILTFRLIVGRFFSAQQPFFDKIALLGLGFFLLFSVSWTTFLIFLVVATGTYLGLRYIVNSNSTNKRSYIAFLIPLQLLPLLYYKYANFIIVDALCLSATPLTDIIIPVGISFYTFQKVAFVIDTLHYHQPMPRFIDYMNFAGFFPQIVAGPIERRQNLLPQMEQFRFRWSTSALADGSRWIALGFFFKCGLADNLAAFFVNSTATNAYLIWYSNCLFGFRIYYDFAGYSLIALGIARALGVNLSLNFESPYSSVNCTEFWRRWHITLSQWFRDYLYIPLGGSRTRFWYLNITLVFIVSGIWHGAGWNFVVWGALHGIFLLVHRLFSAQIRLPRALGWIITMISVFFAWLAFYETKTGVLLKKIETLFTYSAYNREALFEAFRTVTAGETYFLALILALTSATLVGEWFSIRKSTGPYSLFLTAPIVLMLVVLTVLIAPIANNGFIYFAF
jgi:alginate O-acetyltransferase complex protein AlgI